MRHFFISKRIILKILPTFSVIVLAITVVILAWLHSTKKNKYVDDLGNENITVKYNAIYRLGKYKKEDAVFKLIELVSNEQPKRIRIGAIEALGRIGESHIAGPLIAISKEVDREIIIAIVNALGKIQGAESTNHLIDILENEDPQLDVIRALGNKKDESAIPVLTKLLDDPDKYIRHNAAQALKKIGGLK